MQYSYTSIEHLFETPAGAVLRRIDSLAYPGDAPASQARESYTNTVPLTTGAVSPP
jgi:hypothetical protein